MTINLDIEVGDIILTGKFRNKRTKVKSIGTDDLGQPTVNGKPLLNLRIEKLMPKEKQSKKTREALDEGFSVDRFKKLAELLKEENLSETENKSIGSDNRRHMVDSGYPYSDDEISVGDVEKMIADAMKLIDTLEDYKTDLEQDLHRDYLNPLPAYKKIPKLLKRLASKSKYFS